MIKKHASWGKSPSSRYLREQYHIDLETFWCMVDAQNGCCAICGIFKGNKLVIDHCHQSKKIRGLLCHSCNTGLGQFGDDISTLKLAIDYLQFQRL